MRICWCIRFFFYALLISSSIQLIFIVWIFVLFSLDFVCIALTFYSLPVHRAKCIIARDRHELIVCQTDSKLHELVNMMRR